MSFDGADKPKSFDQNERARLRNPPNPRLRDAFAKIQRGDPTVVIASIPHRLNTGDSVQLLRWQFTGTGDVNGTFAATVVDDKVFAIPVDTSGASDFRGGVWQVNPNGTLPMSCDIAWAGEEAATPALYAQVSVNAAGKMRTDYAFVDRGRKPFGGLGASGRNSIRLRMGGQGVCESFFEPDLDPDPRDPRLSYANNRYAWQPIAVACDLREGVDMSAPVEIELTENGRVTARTCMARNDRGILVAGDGVSPVLNCPESVTAECSVPAGTPVGDVVIQRFLESARATDDCDLQPLVTSNAPMIFSLGSTAVQFVAKDDFSNSSMCSQNVRVVDTTAPVISRLTASTTELWPPNHTLRRVVLDVTATDSCDASIGKSCRVVEVVSNEPDSNFVDDDLPGDIRILGDNVVMVRSERSGAGTGRVYTITMECTDRTGGNSSRQAVAVKVPHDKRR